MDNEVDAGKMVSKSLVPGKVDLPDLRLITQDLQVFSFASREVIENDDSLPTTDEFLRNVGTNETGTTGYNINCQKTSTCSFSESASKAGEL